MKATAEQTPSVAGCSDDSCINGVCPNFDEARTLPGPCESAAVQNQSSGVAEPANLNVTYAYTFEYSASGELARVVTDVQEWQRYGAGNFRPATTESETLWSYDANGAVSAIDTNMISLADMSTSVTSTWRFDPQRVTETLLQPTQHTLVFDAASFAFLPMVGSEQASPGAEFGLLSADQEMFRWVVRSPTRLDLYDTTNPVYGALDEFTLDADGRLLNWLSANGTDSQTISYSYEQGRLAHETDFSGSTHTYSYDRGGNIVEHVTDTGYREVYSYACWN